MRFALGLDCGWVLGKVWLKSEGLERSALFLEGLVLGKVAPQFQDCVFLEIPLFLGVSQFQEFSDCFFLGTVSTWSVRALNPPPPASSKLASACDWTHSRKPGYRLQKWAKLLMSSGHK